MLDTQKITLKNGLEFPLSEALEYDDPNTDKVFIIGNEYGICGAICVYHNQSLEYALDELMDAGKLKGLQIDEDDYDEEIHTRLGNYGDPVDLTYMWFEVHSK